MGYRCLTGKYVSELEMFSGRTIDVPARFIAGKSDWGVYQFPGALERMETIARTQWRERISSMAPDTGFSRNSQR